jgi:hypothetical protein
MQVNGAHRRRSQQPDPPTGRPNMTSSVREYIRPCQAGCPRTEIKLSALPQVNSALGHVLTGQDVFVIALLIPALVATWYASEPTRELAWYEITGGL